MSIRQARWPWILVALAVVAAGAWLLLPQRGKPVAGEQNPPGPAPPPAEAPMATDAPGIRHPLDPQDMADAAIPALGDSDAAAWDVLAELAGDASVLDVLLRDHLVQRLVTMIDNLTEPRIPTRALAMRALPGDFITEAEADGEGVRIAAANAQRYQPWVSAFVQADPVRLAAAYRRFYPLFQQAYAEIGGPDAYFNDRLVAVIDHLLLVPEPDSPALLAPAADGRFRYLDPALESRSVGHKALLRLSGEQRDAVKRQLRAVRAQLARG